MDVYEKAIKLVEEHVGKLAVTSKVQVNDMEGLSVAYTPGVARPTQLIHKNKELAYKYTSKGNLVAVLTDGTAVLGLGDVGPEAALVVMEGKAIMMKAYGDIDAFPICLNTTDTDEIVKTMKYLEPTFGGVNLEDISAPRCFEVERRLTEELDIPVFHDDQHGTAIVAVAALLNALKIVGKKKEEVNVVINGAGAAGIATANLLQDFNIKDIVVCDTKGAIFKGRGEGMNVYKEELSERTNLNQCKTLKEALRNADVFIGVSEAGALSGSTISTMKDDPIILALANPDPEIMPEEAKRCGAAIVGTGRMDYPNQVNNLLAFPGVLRGALDSRAKCINKQMKIAAVMAISGMVKAEELNVDYILPNPLDKNIAICVANAVYKAAHASGVARKFTKERYI